MIKKKQIEKLINEHKTKANKQVNKKKTNNKWNNGQTNKRTNGQKTIEQMDKWTNE
jgi:hypothetical protein